MSIIIPTQNRSSMLICLLNSLINQKLPSSVYEILVIDNAPTDNTEELVKCFIMQHPAYRIHYTYEEIPGLLSGRHHGLKEAHADILTFLDDDVVLEPEYTLHILRAFADNRVDIVGGPSIPRFEKEAPAWLEHYFHKEKNGMITCFPLSLLDFGNKAKDIAPEYVFGLNFSVRKQALCDLGGFHPDCYPQELLLLMGDGETGLTLKAKEQGMTARYEPGARVEHIIPASRLTEAYFKFRFFTQGISNSYTAIRRGNGISDIALPEYRAENIQNSEDRYARIHNAYVDGFLYHQGAVRQNPELLSWVLRTTYFDYTYPDVSNMRKWERPKFIQELISHI
ncbi:MAG: glycosyltransferase family 2 protein [Desulfovibrio sp.]|jgi:glycosyltransferase involved in cell wall biosynthesis|nr:glycosyltransferase family 2 protein [Desulfovibrio sp.]